MTINELRKWYEAESGRSSYDAVSGLPEPRYAEWLERRFIQAKDRFQDNEADGLVFCGKCGKLK